MPLRRIVFWSHLVAGTVVGLVVFFLAATGVALTYERQIVAFAERQTFTVAADGRARLDLDALAAHARDALGDSASLVLTNDPEGPVQATAGRRDSVFLDPYTGAALGSGVEGVETFFGTAEQLHRWFALTGDARTIGRFIIDAANLLFLFILASGLFLWWPKRWRWPLLKTKLLFRRGLPTAKARDYNWHQVFGIWALLPLVLIVVSGVVFSYSWANGLVFALYGEATPQGPGGPPPPGNGQAQQAQGSASRTDAGRAATLAEPVSLDAVFATARAADPAWRTIALALPAAGAPTVTATVDTGNGVQPAAKTKLAISRADGSIVSTIGGDQSSAGRRARGWLRFIHTGEIYGIIGQTVAGLASLATLFLVWTGLSLAWRRLIWPLTRKPPGQTAQRAGG
ncbi:PepSY-associated TM helix domain-containing protein [Amorphus sp. MBR-141]